MAWYDPAWFHDVWQLAAYVFMLGHCAGPLAATYGAPRGWYLVPAAAAVLAVLACRGWAYIAGRRIQPSAHRAPPDCALGSLQIVGQPAEIQRVLAGAGKLRPRRYRFGTGLSYAQFQIMLCVAVVLWILDEQEYISRRTDSLIAAVILGVMVVERLLDRHRYTVEAGLFVAEYMTGWKVAHMHAIPLQGATVSVDFSTATLDISNSRSKLGFTVNLREVFNPHRLVSALIHGAGQALTEEALAPEDALAGERMRP